jgi:hypothetical protein
MSEGQLPDPLLRAYAEAASEHGEATAAGDSSRANEAHDVIAAIYRDLRELGIGAQRRLLPLLDHPDAWVVAWSGAHALEFAPEEGERALTELARRERSLAGFTAETTLSVWRDGKLTFP